MKKLIINATRQGYSTDQIRNTLTAGELIEILEDFDPATPIYLGHDIKSYGWYTYGGILERDIYDDEARAEAFGEDIED